MQVATVEIPIDCLLDMGLPEAALPGEMIVMTLTITVNTRLADYGYGLANQVGIKPGGNEDEDNKYQCHNGEVGPQAFHALCSLDHQGAHGIH